MKLTVISREIVISPHSNPSDAKNADILTTVYQTLLWCTLTSWPQEHAFKAEEFTAFVLSVIDTLPSSSQTLKPSNVAIFAEYLVDLVWAADSAVDEQLNDARTVITEHGGDLPVTGPATALSNAIRTRDNADKDKQTLASIVKTLLVSLLSLSCLL